MIKSNIQQFLRGERSAGLEVVFHSEGSWLNMVILKKKGQILNMESKALHVDNLTQLKQEVSIDNLPFSLVVNGKGIITRKISAREDEEESSLINKVLPNADSSEFYLQANGINEEEMIVSIIRRPAVDELIAALNEEGMHVVDLLIGPMAAESALLLLTEGNQAEISIGTSRFQVKNGKITGYNQQAEEEQLDYRLSGELLPATAILPFAMGFRYFFPNPVAITPEIEFINKGKKEYLHKRLFTMSGWSVLAFFLLLLLTNFMVFDHYRQKQQRLENEVTGSSDMLQNIQQMEAELAQKKDFMLKMGVLEDSRTSYFADRIASSIPEHIQLTELFVYPLVKKQRSTEDRISFMPKQINIQGNAKRSNTLNDWIKTLKALDWVKGVNILNYSQADAVQAGSFSLEVLLN